MTENKIDMHEIPTLVIENTLYFKLLGKYFYIDENGEAARCRNAKLSL